MWQVSWGGGATEVDGKKMIGKMDIKGKEDVICEEVREMNRYKRVRKITI